MFKSLRNCLRAYTRAFQVMGIPVKGGDPLKVGPEEGGFTSLGIVPLKGLCHTNLLFHGQDSSTMCSTKVHCFQIQGPTIGQEPSKLKPKETFPLLKLTASGLLL